MFCLILLHIKAHPVQNVMNQVFHRLLTATLTTFWQTAILKLKCFSLDSQVTFWKYLKHLLTSCICEFMWCMFRARYTLHSHILEKPTHASPHLLSCTYPADMRVPQQGFKDYTLFNISWAKFKIRRMAFIFLTCKKTSSNVTSFLGYHLK